MTGYYNPISDADDPQISREILREIHPPEESPQIPLGSQPTQPDLPTAGLTEMDSPRAPD